MQNKKIPFNYFYNMFQDKVRKQILEIERSRIGETADELSDIFDFYSNTIMPKNEKISLYNQAVYDVCADYVALSDSSIDVYPVDTLEFVDQILDTMHQNPYKESFLMSLQFIYRDYLGTLEKGVPTLMTSEDSTTLSSFQITLNSRYQITDFEAINMDIIEENKIINKIVSMETNHQIGPIPKVLYRIRKDI